VRAAWAVAVAWVVSVELAEPVAAVELAELVAQRKF
jgi:hypothetical protein